MYRILVNMPSQYTGRQSGVARTAFNLLERLLANSNNEYILRSPWTKDQLPAALQGTNLEVVTVARPKYMILDVFSQLLSVPKLCREKNIDLVLNIDPYGAARGGRARIMIVHDIYFKTIAHSTGWREAVTSDIIFRIMLRGNTQIVAVSKSTQNDLSRFYTSARDKSCVIYQASTLQPSEAALSAKPKKAYRYVLAVGNATHNKNFSVLGKAMRRLHSRYPDVRVIHVGEDARESIADGMGPISTTMLIRLSGINDAELHDLYRNAECLCVTSISEGFCLPVLEAQQAGCPVVCSDRSATPEIAGGAALTFDPDDVDALVQQLSSLFAPDFPRQDLVTRGRDNAAGFSWERAARAYETAFAHALEQPGSLRSRQPISAEE